MNIKNTQRRKRRKIYLSLSIFSTLPNDIKYIIMKKVWREKYQESVSCIPKAYIKRKKFSKRKI